jgi:hypothetical protein
MKTRSRWRINCVIEIRKGNKGNLISEVENVSLLLICTKLATFDLPYWTSHNVYYVKLYV